MMVNKNGDKVKDGTVVSDGRRPTWASVLCLTLRHLIVSLKDISYSKSLKENIISIKVLGSSISPNYKNQLQYRVQSL